MSGSNLCLVVLIGVNLARLSAADMYLEASETTDPMNVELAAQSRKLCSAVGQEPYFEPELVLGAPWKVYYNWKMDLHNTCITLKFKIATPSIIRRFYYDMNENLEEQPAWGAASLLLNMGKLGWEILLFHDQGPAGKFVAVPNVLRDGSINLRRAPLFNFQMKLEKNGKYLMIVDCQTGVATLSARSDQPPDRAEISSLATSYKPLLGEDGYDACVEQKDLGST